ncbi:MAG: hypothetical protein ACRDY7_15415 [Acidimicrobiia bacterium]
MLITNHVLSGALVGTALRRRPALAFVAGVASHVAMDCLPHWGLHGVPQSDERFLRVARRDGTAGLAAMTACALAAPARLRPALLAAMAGATVLDVDKPAKHFFGWNPVPERLQGFHERIQREAPHRLRGEVLAGAALMALAAAALSSRRSV